MYICVYVYMYISYAGAYLGSINETKNAFPGTKLLSSAWALDLHPGCRSVLRKRVEEVNVLIWNVLN